jgi:hypothetical protein
VIVGLHTTTQYYTKYMLELKRVMPDFKFVVLSRHESSLDEIIGIAKKCSFIITSGLYHKGSKYCPFDVLSKYTKMKFCVSIGHSTAPPVEYLERTIAPEGHYTVLPSYIMASDLEYSGHYMYLHQPKIRNAHLLFLENCLYIPEFGESCLASILDDIAMIKKSGRQPIIRPHPGIYIKNGRKGRGYVPLDYSDYVYISNESECEISKQCIYYDFDRCNSIHAKYSSSTINEFCYRKSLQFAIFDSNLEYNRESFVDQEKIITSLKASFDKIIKRELAI